MISIRKKDYDNPPARLTDNTSRRQIRKASETRNGKAYSGNVYRDASVVNLLKAYSIGQDSFDPTCEKPKCYYCESQGEEKGKFAIEHYRPKDGLSKDDLSVGQEHNGYYWLGNEWSNLLLACNGCNGNGAKGTRFPIFNSPNRKSHSQPVDVLLNLDRTNCVISSEFLISESPVLLNPECDVPEDHLTFDEAGQIHERNNSERGKKTIEVLDLKRESLQMARKDIVDSFEREINPLIEYREQNKMTDDLLRDLLFCICEKIHERRKANLSYTLWGRYINDNFETIFVSKIPDEYKSILQTAYQSSTPA